MSITKLIRNSKFSLERVAKFSQFVYIRNITFIVFIGNVWSGKENFATHLDMFEAEISDSCI